MANLEVFKLELRSLFRNRGKTELEELDKICNFTIVFLEELFYQSLLDNPTAVTYDDLVPDDEKERYAFIMRVNKLIHSMINYGKKDKWNSSMRVRIKKLLENINNLLDKYNYDESQCIFYHFLYNLVIPPPNK